MIRFILRRLAGDDPGPARGSCSSCSVLAVDPRRSVPGGPRRAGHRCRVHAVHPALRPGQGDPPGLYRENFELTFRVADVPATLLDNQFTTYLGSLSRGDLGESIKFSRPVTDAAHRAPAGDDRADRDRALSFAILVGIPLGLISGYRRNSADRRRDDGRSPTSASRCRSSSSACSSPIVFALVLQGHPAQPAAVRPPQLGDLGHPAVEVWGLPETSRVSPRAILDFMSGIYSSHRSITGQWGALGDAHPPPDPAGHRAGHDPARDHRPDHPLQPARGPRPGLRPDGPGQGPARAVRRVCATRRATRCCRS